MPKDFSEILHSLPIDPGVYLYYNTDGEVIYVGKAKNLKKRVSSYFQKTNHPIKVQRLVSLIEKIDFIVLNSESEALLLECDLIKQYLPRYNILLRDDKSFPYIALDARHDFPKLEAYRGEAKEKGIEFYGPYASPGTVRKTLEVLQQLFLLRQCSDHEFKTRKRPCLQYQIKRCSAPCVKYISKQDYQLQVDYVRDYLMGKQQRMIELFTQQMHEASRDQYYEQAAYCRDKIKLLQKLHQSTYAIDFDESIDLIYCAEIEGLFGAYCFSFRQGQCQFGKFFEVQNESQSNLREVLASFIMQYYDQVSNFPEKIVVEHGLEDKKLLSETLYKRHQQKISIQDKPKAQFKTWFELAFENLKQSMQQHHKQLFEMKNKFDMLQTALGLSRPIETIECFDISHTMGEATVGSCVVFNNQGPDKKNYRIYTIENITPGDDYAAMRQVVYKRYQKRISAGKPLPDIILIDGGKGQLSQAVEVLEGLNANFNEITVIGVAKGPERKPGWETLFRYGEKEPIHIASDSSAFFLIQNVRDEAHRFAITKHRSKRLKRGLQSKLEWIPGVGKQRRKQLLDFFGGLEEIKLASVNDLAKVPGISHNLATVIFEHLRDKL